MFDFLGDFFPCFAQMALVTDAAEHAANLEAIKVSIKDLFQLTGFRAGLILMDLG